MGGGLESSVDLNSLTLGVVHQHPPDWDKMEIWENKYGGYCAATLLRRNPTSPSDAQLSMVRTLVADVERLAIEIHRRCTPKEAILGNGISMGVLAENAAQIRPARATQGGLWTRHPPSLRSTECQFGSQCHPVGR